MKKTILLAAMLLMTLGVKAQDTIWDASLGSDYLITEDNWIVSDTGFVGSGGDVCKFCGKYFFAKDKSLRIYGIAAMLEIFILSLIF